MPSFEVYFEGTVPEWNSIRIDGVENADEAEDVAYDEISLAYPEMSDISVMDVKEIID